MPNALERSPSLSAKLDEEETRDLLLLYPNGQLEGKATGETFNYMGKTDILVRERDKNVFIGECKILRPEEQAERGARGYRRPRPAPRLLPRLARHQGSAPVVHPRREPSPPWSTKKALAAIRSHPTLQERPGEDQHPEERHDFVLHATGGPDRAGPTWPRRCRAIGVGSRSVSAAGSGVPVPVAVYGRAASAGPRRACRGRRGRPVAVVPGDRCPAENDRDAVTAATESCPDGEEQEAVAAVRGSGVGSAKADPLRVIPERGQVTEDFLEPARAERGDVLQEDVAGSKMAKAVGDGEPEATAGPFRDAGPGPA